MKQFQFQVLSLDRIELRNPDSRDFHALSDLGADGWHVVCVRDDAQYNRHLLFIMEREAA